MLLLHLPLHLAINQMYHEPIHRILNRHTLPPARRILHLPDLTRGRDGPGRQLQILSAFHHKRRPAKGILLALRRAIQKRLGSITAVVDRLVGLPHVQARDFREAKVLQECVLALEAGVGVVDVGDADEDYLFRVAGRLGGCDGGRRHVKAN